MRVEQLDLLDGARDGDTYTDADLLRLNKQAREVFLCMKDQKWRTLGEISDQTGNPEASVSARLRDLRKRRFGGMTVERKSLGDGLFQYRIESFGGFGR